MSEAVAPRSWLRTLPGTLWLLALATGALAWWLVAWPVVTLSNVERHATHFPQVFVHTIGGTVMLLVGALNLWLGVTRRHFRWHRPLGWLYLAGGTLGAVSAIVLALGNGHRKPPMPFALDPSRASDTGWALATLGAAWLLATAMAWRAARNRRFDAHRQWMVRSYVLVWSFVLCRLVGKVAAMPERGAGAAIIWLSWVLPLLACEVVLQWPAGRRQVSGR